MPGMGGNWVSYMTWCYHANTVPPGSFWHFSQDIIREREKRYTFQYWLQHHDNEWKTCDIVLGSNRAWINHLLMNWIKNDPEYPVTNSEIQNFDKRSLFIAFNLPWHWIVEDPEQFVSQLNFLSGDSIQFNSIVEQCFVQYLDSSYPPEYRGDGYRSTDLINRIHRHIVNSNACRDQGLARRIEHAWELLDSQWIKYDPVAWHG